MMRTTTETNLATSTEITIPTDILRLEPLVGDTACHLHSAHLLHLYRKMLQHPLTDDDKKYLRSCLILSAVSKSEYDVNRIKLAEKTDIEQVPFELWPKEIADKKSAAKNRYLASLRAFVTLHNFSFIRQIVENPAEFLGSYQKYLPRKIEEGNELQYPLYISSSEQRLPILPAYLTGKIFLYYLVRSGSILLVDLIRFHVPELINATEPLHKQRRPVHRDCIYYKWNSEHQRLLPVSRDTLTGNIPVLILTMYSYLLNANSGVEPCFEDPDHERFLTEFKKLDFAFLFLAYMAGHIPVPPGNSVKSDCGSVDDCRSEFATIDASATETTQSIDVTKCSREEYHLLARYALRHGIFTHTAEQYCASQSRPVAYGMNHVHLGLYSTGGN